MTSMQLGITEKILQEAEDNMMTTKNYVNQREQTTQKRNIFTTIIGAASDTELQQEIIARQMMKLALKTK